MKRECPERACVPAARMSSCGISTKGGTTVFSSLTGEKAFFYFKNRRNYISLFANGQINVREDDGMFKPWGVSEFKDIKPQNLFERLEKEIAKIKIPSSGYESDYHFYSYGEFLDWLRK